MKHRENEKNKKTIAPLAPFASLALSILKFKPNRNIKFNVLAVLALIFAIGILSSPCHAEKAKTDVAPRAATGTAAAPVAEKKTQPAAKPDKKEEGGNKGKKKNIGKEKTGATKKPAGKKETPADSRAQIKNEMNTGVVPDDAKYKDDFAKNIPDPVVRSPVVYLGRVILSLFIVIALIVSTVYVLKYFYSRGLGMRGEVRGRQITVVDTAQLGVNRTVYLVKYGSKVALLGTGDKGLTYLADATGAVDLEEIAEAAPPEGPAAGLRDFRRQFNQALGRRGRGLESERLDSKLKDRLKSLEEDEPRDA